MEKVAIIGTGLIGRAWAMVFARAGHTVKLYDSTPGAAEKAIGLIREGLEELQQFGLIKDSPDAVMKRVSGAATLTEAVRDADYVQENTSERLDVKREVYRQVFAIETLTKFSICWKICMERVLHLVAR